MQASLHAIKKKPLPHMLCVTTMLLRGIEDLGFVRHDNTLARPYVSWSQAERVDIVLTNAPFSGRGRTESGATFPSISVPVRHPPCSSPSSSACSAPAAAPR